MKKFLLLLLLLPVFSFKPATTDYDVFFGDSITFGNELGPLQYTARWPAQYCNDLATYEVNEALSGAAITPGVNAGRPVFNIADVPAYQASFHHIFVSYWVNDYLYGGTTAAYAEATTAAVDGIVAKGWPAAKIVLCFNYLPESPGTWVNMTDAKARQWLAALRGVQQAKGTSFLDFYSLIYNRSDNATYSGDYIHPTAAWNTVMKQYAETSIEEPSAPLPVRFAAFSGRRQGAANLLTWTVAQEEGVVHYNVNRSEDGITWTKAGEVAGFGNSTGPRSYRFTDSRAGSSKQLYRLGAVEAGGTVKLSGIIILKETKTTTMSFGGLFPNPVASTLNLVLNVPAKESITVSLLDVLGHTVRSREEAAEEGANSIDLKVSDMKAGVYFVRIVSGAATIVERFVKE